MALNNAVATRLPVTIVANTSALVMSNGAIWTYLVPGSVDIVSPGEGQEGTRIVINGTNLLGGGTSVERIFLDGVPGVVLELFENSTITRIVVAMRNIGERVPSFCPGQVYIMSDTGAIVFGGMYTHRPSGQITTFSPQRGRRGTRITLNGINLIGFGNTVNRVLVAGTPGSVESFDNTSATISAGNSTAGTQGRIQLIINTGAVITSTTNFTYDPPGVISRVVPRTGAEGTGLLIQGTALTPSTSQVVNITIGGNPVSRIVTATDSEISIIVGPAPAMNPTNAAIVIAADDGSIVDGESFAFINLTISLPGQDRGQEGTYIDIQLPYELA
ncbi:MAG: IPT/TIG domain-containing protein, partial [Proteobacteria bacterium]|nr:IPT/TIG domain-containing protein [Pseudomonadota bacterium]